MTANLGPRLARTPMHMFWLLDVSGSMSVDGKIDALNQAMSEAASSVKHATEENPGVQVLVRVVTFADDAAWHVAEPVDIEHFRWSDVSVVERGTTELGKAISLATQAIRLVSQAGKGLPPALVLVSDGRPTDLGSPSFGGALRELQQEPWGRKASRMAIGIGQDADMQALQRFIGHDEIAPLHASNAEELSRYLKWASTVVVEVGAQPPPTWQDPETPIAPEAIVAQASEDLPPPPPPPSPVVAATSDVGAASEEVAPAPPPDDTGPIW